MEQELSAKGLAAADIEHGLRHVFGDGMRINVGTAEDDRSDDGITSDTRYGVQSSDGPVLSLRSRRP